MDVYRAWFSEEPSAQCGLQVSISYSCMCTWLCYRPIDIERARDLCKAERQKIVNEIKEAGAGQVIPPIPKVPFGSKLKKVRDAINAEIFQGTVPVANGDADLNDLHLDIRTTVDNLVKKRDGMVTDYRIHFY